MSTIANSLGLTRGGPERRLALIVDANAMTRKVITSVVVDNGYDTISTTDGAEAVELSARHRPDVILMDAIMPSMNGDEAAGRIKQMCGDAFVPILILTASKDPEVMAKCIEAGADDILSKPFHPLRLSSKLRAMERIRDLHHEVRGLYRQLRRDEQLAEQVFNQAVAARNVHVPQLRTYLSGLSTFSGDVLLSEYTPAGDLHLLLGDFTGHGLAAALGALPAAEVFRAMTEKGFTPEQILAGINAKLINLLPTGMFMAVQFVQLDHGLRRIRVINHGMPELLMLDGTTGAVRERIGSGGLPLGITSELELGPSSRRYPVHRGDRLLMCSDGVIEARNPLGEIFGAVRYNDAVTSVAPGASHLDAVVDRLERFRGKADQADDISLVEVPFEPEILRSFSLDAVTGSGGYRSDRVPALDDPALLSADFEMSMAAHGASLRDSDLVPRMFGQLRDHLPLEAHHKAVFTIITELYVNALDHGVLGLDSRLKSGADGFADYFVQREKRLAGLTSGSIRFELRVRRTGELGELLIQVKDSGPGFDFEAAFEAEAGEHALSGRGLRLVRELSDELRVEPPGNHVIVVFRW